MSDQPKQPEVDEKSEAVDQKPEAVDQLLQQQPSVKQPEQQASQTTQESCTIDVSANQPGDSSQEQKSKFNRTLNRVSKSLMERHISYDPVSIVFTISILIGGLLGFALRGSHKSLISGTIFAILLAICTYVEGARKNPYPLLVVLFVLGGVMSMRYYATGNFMPAGFFALMTLLMIARNCYLIYLKSKYNNQVN